MVISFEKSFLFIHVPKTGGTSIRTVLLPYQHRSEMFCVNRLLSAIGIPNNHILGSYRHFRFRTHDPIRRVAGVYPTHVMDGLLKFAFVRNPWDLLVSYHNFLRATPSHKRHRRVSKLSFEEFLPFAIRKGIGRQHRLITDATGRLLVDKIGRFETLQADFHAIADTLRIEAQLPHVNRGKGHDYRENYTTRTRRLVERAYADDIEAFGYEFDGHSSATLTRPASLTRPAA